MNKIIVDTSNLNLSNEEVFIEGLPNKLILNITGNVYCGIGKFHNKELIINLQENANLTLEFLLNSYNSSNKIRINNEKNSQINLNYACIYQGINELIIENIMSSSNNSNSILVRAIENDGSLNIKATGIIEKNTYDNNYLEDIKALTNNCNSVKIMPDLIVKANEINANHFATISPVNEHELFFLESRGLSNKKATSLIKEGFLKGILINEELKSLEVKIDE